MKLGVSLLAEDVATLDTYARATGLRTRSAAVQQAIRLLRFSHLDEDYAAAWEDWEASGGQAVWEGTGADGLADAAR